MALATAAALGGSVLGTAGQIAGGLLAGQGQMSPGDMILPTFDPRLNAASSAANLNILSALGFGNINDMADPLDQLVGRIQGMQLDEKTKRRAITSLQSVRQQMASGVPLEQALGAAPRSGRLNMTLSRLNVNPADLQQTFNDARAYEQQIQKLRDAGMTGINTDAVMARYKAAVDASRMIGDASQYAQTGEATGVINSILEQDNRAMQGLQDRVGLLANFGGMSGAQAVQTLSDAELDQQLRVLERTLGYSNAIQAALAPATTAASNTTNQSLNAAQIAASQAQAANSLRAQLADNRASSFGNAISGAASSLGSGIGNAAMMSQLFGGSSTTQPSLRQTGGMDFSSPGSTGNQIATGTAQWGGYNPYVFGG